MMLGQDIRTTWLGAGWKRGVFIRLDSNKHLNDELPKKLVEFLEDKECACIVPVLYDCALLESDFDKEPWAQVLVVWKTDPQNDFLHAKNPRKLHLKAMDGDEEVCFEISAISFIQVEREVLLKACPDRTLLWGTDAEALLLDWVAERYRQATFPDEFNNRLKLSQRMLKKLWKSELFCEFASGIYVNIDTSDELPENSNYKIKVIIAIPFAIKGREFSQFDRNHSEMMVMKLKSILDAVKGIEVLAVETMSERSFTKEIEREYNRFSLEYFSYKSPTEVSPLPAEYYGG